MNIFIKDDQGLDSVLMMDGYSREQRQEAKQIIRQEFREAATKVFQDILKRPLPEILTINMSLNTRDEVKGETTARLAEFNVRQSDMTNLVFSIREITVKTILDKSDYSLFKGTVIHEMFHAADQCMLENSNKLFKGLRDDIYKKDSYFQRYERDSSIANLKTLQVFDHYRAEGIAILGETLLMNRKCGPVTDATTQFCFLFELTMLRSLMKMEGKSELGDIMEKDTIHSAYGIAQTILLLVLGKRGDVEQSLLQRALEGLNSGNYNLTDENVYAIMRSALGLSLIGYIQGLLLLGDNVAPIRPFLNFCASLQKEWEEGNINAFEELIQQPESTEAFNTAMSEIMGSCMADEELDKLFDEFMKKAIDDSMYPLIKEKLAELHTVLKNETNVDRRKLAQWALTYFFDDQDIIHDDVLGLGLIDDLTIIDYALRLLKC